jgi:maltooligosyltrehalose trehalohydrolase
MPIADFPGDFGWGYDGVDWFAPTRLYGSPDDFRRFVDRAHALGVGVILDVVYNHLGPDGNYLKAFSPAYFTDRYETDWGEAINYDGPDAGPVREFVKTNAAYWIDEFHLDGLRLDATQNIYDTSENHILAELGIAARKAAGRRSIYLVAENEPQEVRLVEPLDAGGYGLDALWNDDLHHTAIVALTGHAEAYYTDYRGTPQELISSLKYGYLYQGQWYRWQKKRRGTPSFQLDRARFVSFLENHDQVANSGPGSRVHQQTSPCRLRAMTTLMLLAPATPMLFQGQEFASTKPFVFFASHHLELAKLVHEGRKKFLAQFPSLADPAEQAKIVDPADPRTFASVKLDWDEVERQASIVALHRDLLRLRREDEVLSHENVRLEGAVLGEEALALRFLAEDGNDRLLLVNLGKDVSLSPIPEPLVADPADRRWQSAFSSDDPRYGGHGTPAASFDQDWVLPAESAQFFISVPFEPELPANEPGGPS